MLAALFFLFCTQLAFAQSPSWQSDFETYLDSVIQTYHMPGVAVEVVGLGGPIMQVTRGYRDVKNRRPVTPRTLFAMGSTTKAFTGVVLAQLRDRGLVDFDSPVQTYWPEFHIQDLSVSPKLTIHDLTSHWTGVGRHDLAWDHRDELTREELLNMIPLLPISAPPRTKYIYNNFMVTAAAHVAEVVTGKSWETLLQEEILDPLGMGQTNASLVQTKNSGDFSLPYAVDEAGMVKTFPFNDIQMINPAGGIYSNLDDMAKWVQMHLNRGVANGRQIVSAASLAETHKPYSVEAPGVGYAMGWNVLTYHGETLLTHDGAIDGFLSNVTLIPGQNTGVVVLMHGNGFPAQAISNRIWEYIFGIPTTDTVGESMKSYKAEEEAVKIEFPDPPVIPMTAPIQNYAGEYCDKLYGAVTVTVVDANQLHVKMRNIEGDVSASAADQFFRPGVYSVSKFLNFGRSGDVVDRLDWMLEDTTSQPISFKRCSGEIVYPVDT